MENGAAVTNDAAAVELEASVSSGDQTLAEPTAPEVGVQPVSCKTIEDDLLRADAEPTSNEGVATDEIVTTIGDKQSVEPVRTDVVEDNNVVADGTAHLENGDVEVQGGVELNAAMADLDAEGYRVEGRRDVEQSSHTEEVRERDDGAEEIRVQESKEITLEEVKSKETERPATLEEFREILEAELEANKPGVDGQVEIAIGKDVLVEEFTRMESSHEEKIDGEVAQSTVTVTEEHKTEESHEIPLLKTPLVNGSEKTEDHDLADASAEETANAAEPAAATAELTASSDEAQAKEKSPKSKGIMGFFKSKTRSQSKDREESAAKEEQHAKKKKVPTATLR